MKPTADALFAYLRDIIYSPTNATLDLDQLPDEFVNFGKGLKYFGGIVAEATSLAKALASGNLNTEAPPPSNEIAAPLKALHASLKHLTWQTQQVAKGDYQQQVDFMGDFSDAFNNMIRQLEQRRRIHLDEKKRLERYLFLMMDNCPDPILLFDRQGCLVNASDSYLRYCDVSGIDQVFGKKIRQLFASVVSDEFMCLIERLFETAIREKSTVETEQSIDFGKNGSRRHYQIQLSPMLDLDGNSEGVMAILHDTTEIVRARREADRAREIAERSSRVKSDFLARMSHEMRTPMNAIIGMTSIYSASEDPERKDDCVGKINEASQHLLGVINDVLDVSMINEDEFVLSRNPFNLVKAIERVVGTMMFRARERDQKMTTEMDPRIPPLIIADEQRLMQVISNLLSNAIKFTEVGGEITLSVDRIGEKDGSCVIRFAVKDNGIGISTAQQQRVFEPFEQADGGVSRKYGGTGLGLTICKRIVEMMGGTIEVESELGQGSRFAFEILVAAGESTEADHEQSDAEGQEEPDSHTSEDGIFAGRSVLLAEDVEINREILCSLLEHTGLHIVSANDGLEAVEKFSAEPDRFDLIFMDIHMPSMDGYESTRRIRASGLPGADTIPIVAMTANVYPEDVERCLEAGMSSHLGKPIDADEVIARLREYLL